MKKKESTKKGIDTGVAIIDGVAGMFGVPSPLAIGKSLTEWVSTIKAENFKKKLILFLKEMQGLKPEDYESFHKTIDDSPKDFSEKVVLLLEQLDDDEKAKIIGKLTKARIKANISHLDYTRLCSVVNRCLYQDIKFIPLLSRIGYRKYKSEERIKHLKVIDLELVEANLFSFGLLKQKIVGQQNMTRANTGNRKNDVDYIALYEPSNLGELLVRLGFKLHVPL